MRRSLAVGLVLAAAVSGCKRGGPALPAELEAALDSKALEVGNREARAGQLNAVPDSKAFVYAPEARAGLQMRVGPEPEQVEVRRGSSWVRVHALSSPMQLQDGAIRKASVVFAARDGHAAAVLTPFKRGVEEDLVLTRPMGDALDFSWRMELASGLTAREAANGAIEIAAADSVVFTMPAPVLRDASGAHASLGKWALSGDVVSLHVSGLASRAYPLTIDPTLITTQSDFGAANLEYGVDVLGSDGGQNDAGGQIVDGTLERSTISTGLGAWTAASNAPNKRAGLAMVGYNGRLYATGGYDGASLQPTTYIGQVDATTSPVTVSWTSGTALPTARRNHASVAYNGFLYVIGGNNGTTQLNDIECAPIDPVSGAVGIWSTQPNAALNNPCGTLPTALESMSAVAYGGYLYVIGGSTGVVTNRVLYAKFNSDGTLGAFTDTSAFITARQQLGAAAYNGRLYLVGGLSSSSQQADTQVAQINSDGSLGAWGLTKTLPTGTVNGITGYNTGVAGHTVVAANGYLYAIGGSDASGRSALAFVSPITASGELGNWFEAANLGSKRQHHATAQVGSLLITVGGEDGSTVYQDTQVATLDQNGRPEHWVNKGTFTTARYEHATVAYNGFLYVLGGNSSSSVFQSTVEFAPLALDGTVGTWTGATALPTGLSAPAAVAYNGAMYVVGGQALVGGVQNKILCANIKDDGSLGSWSQVGALVTARSGAAAVVHDGWLLVVGGQGTLARNDVEVSKSKLPSGCPASGTAAFTTTSASTFTTARYGLGAAVYNGYLYVVAGLGTSALADVQYAKIDGSAGTLGSFTTSSHQLAAARDFLGVAVNNGYLYAFGGQSGLTTLPSTEVAPILTGGDIGAFQSGPDLDVARWAITGAVYNGVLFATGGLASTPSNEVSGTRLRSPGTLDVWSPGQHFATGQVSRFGHASVAVNGNLYVLGGNTGTGPLADSWYVPINGDGTLGNTWTQATNLSVARSDLCAVSYGGRIYAIGGLEASTTSAVVDIATLNADGSLGSFARATTTPLPVGIDSAACVVFGNVIYVIGGESNGSDLASVVYSAINSDGSLAGWTTASNVLSTARHGPVGAVYNGHLYAAGGISGTTLLDSVEVMSLASGVPQTATAAPSMPFGVGYAGGAASNGFLYVLGGRAPASPSGFTNVVQVAPINQDGSLGNWGGLSTNQAGNTAAWAEREQHGVALYNGFFYVTAGKVGSAGASSSSAAASNDVWAAQQLAPSARGTWSKYVQLGALGASTGVQLDSVEIDGTSADGTAQLDYRVTTPDGGVVFGPLLSRGTVAMNTPIALGDLDVTSLWLRVTLDDTNATAINPDANNNKLVTQIIINSHDNCAGVTCATPDQCHRTGTCNPYTSLCVNPALDNGTLCNDGDACTSGETCQGGVCGSPTFTVTCAAQDQCHAAGVCNPADAGCTNPELDAGTPCDDGDACTQGETCQAGVCTSPTTTTTCAPLDACHLAGVCNPSDGGCSNPPAPDDAGCDDGLACTTGDRCLSGVCTPTVVNCTCANDSDCPALDQCHASGVCDVDAGLCNYAELDAGTPCDDGNACTGGETCQNGACTAPTFTVTCGAPDVCHTAGSCDPGSGLCVYPQKPNNTACDDGSACTSGETCQNGVCGSPTSTVTCAPLDACHGAGTCNPSDGGCSNPAVADNTTCEDGRTCTQGDRCLSGVCTPIINQCQCNQDSDCAAPDGCHTAATCDVSTGTCVYPKKPDNSQCDDGNACTSGETCQNGVCGSPTSTVTCTALDQCHVAGSCDPTSGQCNNPVKQTGAPCDDGRTCTIGDFCDQGTCTSVSNSCACNQDSDCPAATQCQATSTCNLATGTCVTTPKPDNTACNDGNACTTGETCQNGVCGAPTSTVTCTAQDSCHSAGTCDPNTGQCSNPAVSNGTLCDDGRSCTQGDSCQNGLCTPTLDQCACTSDNDCPAQDDCHQAGTCNHATGTCSYANKADGTVCDDHNACTTGETCHNGACTQPTTTVTCAAQDQCHQAGVCDPTSGQCSSPTVANGTACDDGSACTSGEFCTDGVCGTPRQTISCPAPNECQVSNVCAAGSGQCVMTAKPDGTSCSVGACHGGLCVSSDSGKRKGYVGWGCTGGGSELALGALAAALLALGRRRRRGALAVVALLAVSGVARADNAKVAAADPQTPAAAPATAPAPAANPGQPAPTAAPAVAPTPTAGAPEVAKPADDHLAIPLHVQGVILGEFVSRQTGGELGASYTVIPHLDLGATAVLGSNIGIRATGMLHPVRGDDIQPFVQLRAIVNPVSGGLGAGGGAWGGASMEVGPGRALVGLMGELYHGPSTFYPYAVLAAAGYEFDPFRPVQQVIQYVNNAPPPPPAPTEAIFKGRVTDLDDKPLQGSLRFTGVPPELAKPYDASPNFEVHLPPGEYHAEASAPGYLTRGRTFTVKAGETLVYDFQLRPESKQQVVIIKNDRLEITQQILFEFNKSRILPFSYYILDEVTDTLFKHPEIRKVRIEGHTDDVGGADFNQRLSEARAKSVMDYLVDKGVSPSRLSAVGYGLTKPIATNKTDEGRAKNRRVQFTIEERSEPTPPNTH